MSDGIAAHAFSSNHKAQLLQDAARGCFYCLAIFQPGKIRDWVGDPLGTAPCPYCGVDAVMGESSGCPITRDLLKRMHSHWF